MRVFKVERFIYNGFCVNRPEDGEKYADYTAEFIEWTSDPGITRCMCSDGVERLIPSCCLLGDMTDIPKQEKTGVLFGVPSNSD